EEPEAEQPRREGFWARLFKRRTRTLEVPPPEPRQAPEPIEEPQPEPPPVEEPPAPEPPAPEPPPLQPVPDPEPDEPLPAAEAATAQLDDDRAVAVLTEVLDNLGAAHHRPFSRG